MLQKEPRNKNLNIRVPASTLTKLRELAGFRGQSQAVCVQKMIERAHARLEASDG